MSDLITTEATKQTTIDSSSQKNFRAATVTVLNKSKQLLENVKKKHWGIVSHSWFFYLLSWIILAIYGGKACPFVDEEFLFASISDSLLLQVSLAMFISIAPLYLMRLLLMKLIGKERMFQMSGKKYVMFEGIFFLVWVVELLIVGIKMDLLYESVLKMTVGSFMFGFFSVLCMFIYRQRFQLLATHEENSSLQNSSKSFLSIRSKFISISVIVLVLVGIVIALVSYKNFLWLVHSIEHELVDGKDVITINGHSMSAGVMSVFKEIIFIIGVFIGWMCITTYIYSTNIRLIFILFNNTIYSLFQGNYNQMQIPSLNDEFGVMGENINIIIDEVKEKENIKATFGKFVSPRIAELILKGGISMNEGGVARDIVVLSSDIRNFTYTTHTVDPRDLVNALNAYFTDMVRIVEKYEGMVDKFIGDAIMGLFGYDDVKKGINNAVYTAIYMQDHQHRIKSDIRIGVGIGYGQAIMGLVGSPDRQDFTAIGDVVNMSFRLESCTKELGVDVLIHENVYKELNDELRSLIWKRFDVQVKGIPKPLPVYGLRFAKEKYANNQVGDYFELEEIV